MLFNSFEFIFIFLPVTLFVFFVIGRHGYYRAAIIWLVSTSLFFYGWWNPVYLGLIFGSIVFNYLLGIALNNRDSHVNTKVLLVFGVAVNLSLLGYFKYANFFVETISNLTGNTYHLETIILPLAISFFTFQQVSYLVDAYQGETQEHDFLHYCLFVTFFPQLIAGPIVHHKEMLPQFKKDSIYLLEHRHLAVGLTIFFFGLFKKVVLADGVAVYATPVFNAAEQGITLTFLDAWCGALAYTFQLYFDFSGYSDMAIGIARMFGILLPLNFNSPYKALNIIEFWQRWHITLSRFLRDYLYIPLGGNRKGKTRRYINLMLTMILGGLWHGAGWTFVAWGILHGFYLVINNAWHTLRHVLGHDLSSSRLWERTLSRMITFAAIVFAWVFFRAESFTGAMNIVQSMVGVNGLIILDAPLPGYLAWISDLINFKGKPYGGLLSLKLAVSWIVLLFGIAWFAPNTQQLMLRNNRSAMLSTDRLKYSILERFSTIPQWQPTLAWVGIILTVAFISIFTMSSKISEFLYFQF